MKDKKMSPYGASTSAVSEKIETPEVILVETSNLCEEVLSCRKKIDSTFFTTKYEAATLKATCDKGDAEAALYQLRAYHGEPSPAVLIRRLEASMVKQAAVEAGGKEHITEPVSHATMASDTLTATQKGRSVEAMSAPVLTANVEENSERINKGFNSTHEYCPEVELIDIDQIEKDPEAADIFERNPTVFESIRDRMEREGFHDYNPAKVWDLGNGRYVPYDGNSRIDVAKELGLKSIPVVKTIFNSRAEFIQAAINEQIDRRNLSVKDKFMVVRYCHPLEAEKARKRHGGQSADKSADSPKGRADTVLGKKIGYGPDTVARIRALIDEDDKDLLESVFTGEISIGGAYEVLKVNKLEDTPKSKKLTEDDSGDGDEVEDESSDETPQENTPVYKGRESDSPRVPIKFLQSVAVLIDINHGEDLLNILGDSYAEAGSIFGEALKGRKS